MAQIQTAQLQPGQLSAGQGLQVYNGPPKRGFRFNHILLPEAGYGAICLTGNTYAIVSVEDFTPISKFLWALNRGTQLRAYRSIGRDVRYMHHTVLFLMGKDLNKIRQSEEVDHINRNTLDNRRENLRVVNHFQNMKNTARHEHRTGFVFHKRTGLWLAYVNFPSKMVSLGYWRTKEKASDVARFGRELQATCSSVNEFKEQWKNKRPRKSYDKTGM